MTQAETQKRAKRRWKGFEQAGSLVVEPLRLASESRGFAVSRVLTHWSEIVGEELAACCAPVSISYGRSGGLGATLTVLVSGAHAPEVQMRESELRDRINACYGYRAIARIRLTQTAPTGFAEGQAAFGRRPRSGPPQPPAAVRAAAEELSASIADPGLRAALAALGARILTPSRSAAESSE